MSEPTETPYRTPGEQAPLSLIEQLEAEAAAAEGAATVAALTPDEQRTAAALGRIAKAREDKAQADKVRRGFDLAAREKAARSTAPRGVLVKGIDLFELFPLGEAPAPELMPGGGVIVVRSPESLGDFHREVEHKKRDVWEIYADLLCKHTVDPVQSPSEGMKLRAFCEHFNGAAIGAGDIVAKLGGSKAQADKRGRS
jgi:hypothetical protein